MGKQGHQDPASMWRGRQSLLFCQTRYAQNIRRAEQARLHNFSMGLHRPRLYLLGWLPRCT